MEGQKAVNKSDLFNQFQVRLEALAAVKSALGPTSLTELAAAAGVNRQTITNALNRSTRSDVAHGPEPIAQNQYHAARSRVLPEWNNSNIAAVLRSVADELENLAGK